VTGGISCASLVGLNGSQVGVNYQLILNGSTNIGSAVGGTGAAFNFGTQSTAGTYTVSAITVSTSCPADMSGSSTVNASPTAVISGSLTGCVNPGVALGTTGSSAGS